MAREVVGYKRLSSSVSASDNHLLDPKRHYQPQNQSF
jgi:hypothetical protein